MRLTTCFISCIMLLATTACAGDGVRSTAPSRPETATVELIKASSQCGIVTEMPGALWIADKDIFQEIYARLLDGHQILGTEIPEAPSIDFSREGVLIIYMGQRPTAGFSISMSSNDILIEEGFANITILFEAPPPGAITAQVITNPCLILKLPAGEYQAIRLIDPEGTMLMETIVEKDICKDLQELGELIPPPLRR